MTHARKSFTVSLAFHAMMGSLAFWFLTQISTPPKITAIPLKIVSYTPLEHPAAVAVPKTVPQPQKPVVQQEKLPVPLKPAVLPVAKPVPTPLPVPAALPVSQPQTATQPSVPVAPVLKTAAVPSAIPAPAAVSKPEAKPDTASEKKALLSALRATIQNHLRYPPAARRRSMEGEVDVRFVLYPDGRIDQIAVARGETIFHNAAKSAVASSGGVSIPKALASSFPMDIELTLAFRLKDADS